MPFSRFRRIRNTAKWRFTSNSIFFLVYIICGAFIFKPSFFDRISWWANFNKENNDPILYSAGLVFILGTILILIKFFKTYNTAKFQKLSVTNGEFEISEETDTSILNKHLDEILYFFEETNYNVLVIEDLDRFQDPEIFTKLRELNTLINSSSQIKRKVVFIYALKDDIFKDNNRTKFFDFIVPVIPVIGTSNSGEKLLKKFHDANMQSELSDTFIMDITLFVDDMRMMKNIYNEYVLYKKKIGLDINQENLLAIIVYKNFYPTDFADLNSNKGLVFENFEHKKVTVNKIIEENKIKIDELLIKLSELEKELPQNVTELRSVYILAMQKKLPGATAYQLNGTDYTAASILEDNVFALLKTQTNIISVINNYSHQRSGISFKAIEADVDAKQTYETREKNIIQRNTGESTKLKQTINQLESENQQLQYWTLKQLIERQSGVAMLPAVKKEKLLAYLLRRGYIDEMYNAYISHFYEGTITRTDMDFVVSVKTYKSLGFDFQLKKIEPILKKFHIGEFGQTEILNTQLLDFLALSSSKYLKEFDAIIKKIGDESTDSFKFFNNYLEKGNQLPKVIKTLGKVWSGMWTFISTQKDFTKEKKDNYFRFIMRHVEIADIEKMNVKNIFTNYINEMDDYLFQFPSGEIVQKQKDVLKKLKIEFKSIKYNPNSQEIFDYIYDQSLYELNTEMLEFMILQKGKVNDKFSIEFQERNYTTILNSDCKPLINYVNTNLDIYVDDIMLVLPNNTKEEEIILVQLLNSESINDQSKKGLISKEETCYYLLEIDTSLWNFILEENKAHPNWDDLLAYYLFEQKDDELLTNYLNEKDNFETLMSSYIGPTDGDNKDSILSFSKFIILNNNLSDESYIRLIKSIPWNFDVLAFENLTPSKIDILLKAKKLTTTKTNYDKLKKGFKGKNIHLLENNYQKYILKKDDYIFDNHDYYLLISSKVLTSKQKIDLIMEIDIELIDSALADLILRFINENENFKISYVIFNKLIEESSTEYLKLSLLIYYLPNLNYTQTEKALIDMGGKYKQISGKGNRPALENFGANERLAQLLKKSDFISSYKVEKGKILINTKRK